MINDPIIEPNKIIKNELSAELHAATFSMIKDIVFDEFFFVYST